MAQWDPSNSIIRLLDKTNPTPTGTTDGGLVNGDLIGTKKMARLIIEEGDGKLPVATLYLKLDNSGQFVLNAPILVDKNAFASYLLETKIAQTIGGVTKYSRLHRFNLGIPTVTQDVDLGWVLQVPCEHIGMEALGESAIAYNQPLVSPHDRATSLLLYYDTNIVFPAVYINYTGTGTVNLPDSDSLKRDYYPTSIQTLADALQEVLDTLKLPGPSGGTFQNYYYWIEADVNNTMAINIHFDLFGAVDSGITIDPTQAVAALLDRTVQTSNKKRRTRIICKYDRVSGSMPKEFQVFASTFAHATQRPEWSSSNSYAVGDNVMVTYGSVSPNILRFFTCVTAVSPGGSTPDQDITHWQEDFTIIPPWNQYAYYTVGEVVTLLNAGNIHFYSCTNIVGPTSTQPNSDPSHWIEILQARSFTNYSPFFSYTPWTNDLQAFVTNLGSLAHPPTGYLGLAPDWNYERQINDLVDYTNRYSLVTGKSVRRYMTAPPIGREPYTGLRILVAPSATGAFAGHANQIAEWYRDPVTFAGSWYFSNNPQQGEAITMIERACMLVWDTTIPSWVSGGIHSTGDYVQYSGSVYVANQTISGGDSTVPPPSSTKWTLNPTAFWKTIWGMDARFVFVSPDKPGPFHAVKSACLVQGATGISAQAIRYRFEFKDSSLGGNDINKTARGCWAGMFYPYPVNDEGTANLGAYYGGNGTAIPNNPMVDHQNLNLTSKGDPGWNNGQDDESKGRISSHSFKIRVGYYSNSDDTTASLSYGKANIAMVYARKDQYGRWFYKDFVVPINGQWFPMTIQLPPFGPNNLYFNRIDELISIFGYTLPLDIFLPEKNFNGVQYDWRNNQSWVVFCKDTYLSSGMYQGNYQSLIDVVSTSLNQAVPLTLTALQDIASGNWSDFATKVQSDPLDHVNIDLDELHYNKEGIAVYPNTIVGEPRYEELDLASEVDYLTAKARAQAEYVQNQFYPTEKYTTITGNIAIYYGQLITEVGSRIAGGSEQSVIANLKTTIDNRGLNQDLYLVRKFII